MRRAAVLALSVLVVGLVPVAVEAQTETVLYYHTDAIGSVRMITNEAGQVVGRYDYWPFGVPAPTDPPAPPEVRQFAGKERDTATGYDYFGGRYYQSLTGRFTTVDPVLDLQQAMVDPQRWNRYGYALNNPLRYIDPDGRNPFLIAWGLYELGSAVYDAYNAYTTLRNPNASSAERTVAVLGAVASVGLPGGGYGTGGKAALGAVDDVAARTAGRTFQVGEVLPRGGIAGVGPGAAARIGAGNLRNVSKGQLRRLGIDAEAMKADFVGAGGGRFNVATDRAGNVFLTPVRKGSGPPIETGLTLDDLANQFPGRP